MITTKPCQTTLGEIAKFKDGIKRSAAPIKRYIDKTCLSNATIDVFNAAVQTAYNDAARTFTGIGGKSDKAKIFT